jgi:hypothetical protein
MASGSASRLIHGARIRRISKGHARGYSTDTPARCRSGTGRANTGKRHQFGRNEVLSAFQNVYL